MFNLYNLYEQVILEAVQRDKIFAAIDKHHRVNITYDDGSGDATGKRTIEVYAYGKLLNGKPAIRAYQIFGDTKTHKPMWKTFLVDNILSWDPLNFIFYTPISDRDPLLKNRGMSYREDNTDKLFSTIWASADFKDQYNKDNQPNTGKVNWGNAEEKEYQEYNHTPYEKPKTNNDW